MATRGEKEKNPDPTPSAPLADYDPPTPDPPHTPEGERRSRSATKQQKETRDLQASPATSSERRARSRVTMDRNAQTQAEADAAAHKILEAPVTGTTLLKVIKQINTIPGASINLLDIADGPEQNNRAGARVLTPAEEVDDALISAMRPNQVGNNLATEVLPGDMAAVNACHARDESERIHQRTMIASPQNFLPCLLYTSPSPRDS